MSFWEGLINRHKLVGGVCDQLAPPVEAEAVSRQLDAALKVAHSSSPAGNTATPLKRMMAYIGPLNQSEFYGLCKGSFQSPSMSSSMANVLTEALLKYIGRCRMDQVFSV